MHAFVTYSNTLPGNRHKFDRNKVACKLVILCMRSGCVVTRAPHMCAAQFIDQHYNITFPFYASPIKPECRRCVDKHCVNSIRIRHLNCLTYNTIPLWNASRILQEFSIVPNLSGSARVCSLCVYVCVCAYVFILPRT